MFKAEALEVVVVVCSMCSERAALLGEGGSASIDGSA